MICFSFSFFHVLLLPLVLFFSISNLSVSALCVARGGTVVPTRSPPLRRPTGTPCPQHVAPDTGSSLTVATQLARRHQQPHPVREQLLLLDATMYWNPWPSRPTGILPLQCREVSQQLHDPSSRSNHPFNHDVRRHGTTVSPRCRTPLNNFTLRRLHVAHQSEREDESHSTVTAYRPVMYTAIVASRRKNFGHDASQS